MIKNKQMFTLAWRCLRAWFSRLTGECRTMVEPRVAAEEVATAMKATAI